MDVSCIISSGDLELYVLGLLPDEDRQKMDQLVLMFPELKAEADRISETLEDLSMQTSRVPHAGVKEKTFAELQDETSPVTPEHEIDKDLAEHENRSIATIKPFNSRKPRFLLAASLIGLLLSVVTIFWALRQNQRQRKELATLHQELHAGRQKAATLEQQNAAYGQLLKIMEDDSFAPVTLNSVPGKPVSAKVKLFWNRQSKEIYLLRQWLPETPAGKQYQLWAIVDGKPVNAGLLNGEKSQLQKMHAFDHADAFAVTLEKTGGSASPSLDQMYVMGKPS